MPAAATTTADEGPSVTTLRRQFENYASVKVNEIAEAREAWCYQNAAQWTKAQIEILRKRGQPAITFPRIPQKINSIVGVLRQLRTDPKAFPRTSKGEKGAELATEVVRYILDASKFEDMESEVIADACILYGVSEMVLVKGDNGDPDIELNYADAKTYFYDPRSTRANFVDRRFDGVAKWVDKDELEEFAPGSTKTLGSTGGDNDGTYFTGFDVDKEVMWIDERGRFRLVDHWYIKDGGWKWCLHVGNQVLTKEDGSPYAGDSPFFDAKGRSISKFFPLSNKIDQDGDHYGFVRELKGPQDAINQHRSKAIHIMNARQIFAEKGVFADIEAARREAARPDGIVEVGPGKFEKFKVDQPNQEFLMQTQYYQDAKAEMDNFGPNPTLTGNDPQEHSGRALAILKQAGLAALGPFLKNYRGWKLAQYQAVWCAAQRYWTAERWIRVTEDQELAGFLQINGMDIDPMTGQPVMVNAIGNIDVDIVMSEGPDTETIRGDINDTMEALAHNGVPVPPPVFVEMSDLPKQQKDKLIKMLEPQPDPATEMAKGGELAKLKAEIEKIKADTGKAEADEYLSAAKAEQILAAIGQVEAEMEVARSQGWMPPKPLVSQGQPSGPGAQPGPEAAGEPPQPAAQPPQGPQGPTPPQTLGGLIAPPPPQAGGM